MKRFTLVLVSMVFAGCSSAPYEKGSPDYIEHQVFQCRKLCANSEVNIAQIAGLDCVCSKPQQTPMVIYNPMMGGGSVERAPATQQVIFREGRTPELTPNDSAARTQDATGKTIYSQTKE